MIEKVFGVKSVDFKIVAKGHGVVNWNGKTALNANKGMTTENHNLPKLRGFTNLSGKEKEGTGFKYKKEPTDIDFKETPLYISQNCIRHHLFKEQAYDLHFVNTKNALELLSSITGLLRGYVITASIAYRRTSPLLIEDFVDQLGNGNFEQFSRSGSKEKGKDDKGNDKANNSFFSKTTFGDTLYIGYGSINICDLQFIPLSNDFDRTALIIKDNEGDMVAKKVQDFIQSLDKTRKPTVTFNANYVRNGTIFNHGEAGLLLDDVAIDILVKKMLDMIATLSIKQGKGYMFVDTLEVDYNDSDKPMRIKHYADQTNPTPIDSYAKYYSAK